MKTRASNLSEADIALIVRIILAWEGSLRWELLVERIASDPELKQKYTRQALSRHSEIAEAFRRRRRAPLKANVYVSLEMQAAEARIMRVEAELALAKKQISGLKERHVLWAYNARIRGITESELDRPLEPIDRSQTVLRPGRKSPLDEDTN